ncbi:MAG: hypothetical protein QG619_2081 [Pseudomonadota bacterium]|nr:hypothetical protein [Pseudomonadota bacterium]
MKLKTVSAAIAVALAAVAAPASASPLSFTHQWTFTHGGGQTSEIASFDSVSNTLWVVGLVGIDVLNASTGGLVQHIDTTGFGSANSIAINNGLAAVAMESSADRTLPGTIRFFDTTTRSLATGINSVTVGALPDMVTFTPDGKKLLVANEGTPNIDPVTKSYAGYDPAGSLSIIDMSTRTVAATATFTGVLPTGGVRYAGMDLEPEYIAVNSAGTKAFVTLQESNALAVLDLNTQRVTSVTGLGTKDFSTAANAIDPNHKDGKIELRSSAVKGLYQPDGIAAYESGGKTYLVMANEGDTREDDVDKLRAKSSGLSGVPADLKELNIARPDSASGSLVTFGGRSFSIRDDQGNLVFDSGNTLEVEAIKRGIYDDQRSDDKGVEPEGVALREIGGKTFAFIGLERTTKGAVAVYDITNPGAASFVDMLVTDGDVSPEGITTFISGGKLMLGIANEVSGTTTVYSISAVPEPGTYAMLLAGLGLMGTITRRRSRKAV